MAEVSSSGSKGVSISIVDPNPRDSGIIPIEDLFIYVSLRIRPKSRSVLESTGEVVDNTNESGVVLNLIGTKTDPPSNNEYMTTNWTNTGGPIGSRKNNETFGIKSISISYGADLLPVVNMTFIDVKGASFFDGFEKTDTKGIKTNQSDFSSFFKIPYPIFELTVKGYYGKAVKYYLNMTKWTAAFSEGNFEIKANFLSYSTSFFSDILMDHVRAIVETPSGKAELKRVFKGKQITTINEMLKNIGNIGKYVENIKAKNNVKDDQGYGRLIKLNETLTNLSAIRNVIGIPIQNLLPTEPNYNSLEGPYIKYEGLIARENIFSFRDIILIPNGTTLITYNKFRENIISQMEKYDDALQGIGGDKYVDSYGISKAIGKQIKEIFPKLDEGGEDVKSVITTINGILVNGGNGRPIDKGYVYSEEFKKPPFELFTGLTKTIKIDQKANMYDFYKIRDVVNKIYVILVEERKRFADEVTEKINKEIDKKYGFNPSVGDVFEILCNNVEAYINTIYRVSLNAENKNTSRVKILTGLENDSDGGRVYPWPMLYENNVETYIGNNKKVIKDESAFPEVAFVEEILNAQIKENDSKNDNIIPLPNDKRSFPINPGDLPISSDPYPFNISNTNQVVLENLMSNIIKRSVISYDYSCLKDNINDIAKLEAASLFSSVVDDIDKSVINVFLENNKSNYFNLPIVQKNLSMVKSGSTYYFGGTLDLNSSYKNISSSVIDSKTLFFDTSINSVSSVTTDFLNQNNYDLLTNVKNTLGDKSVSDVFTPKKEDMEFNTTSYSVEQNLTKMCWDEAVLDGKSYPQPDKLKNYVGMVKDGITQNTYYLYNSPSYQNYSATTVTQVLGGGLYNNLPENQFRGMMILSTYPFKGIDKLVENLTDITKVVNVPLPYLAWIGFHMKRQQLFIKNNDVDLIKMWFIENDEFSSEQIGSENDYLSLGSKTNNKGILPKPFNDYNLFNPTIENVFIGVFEYWCYLAKESGLIDYYLELGGQTLTSQTLQQLEELGGQTKLTKILNSINYKTTNELIELVSYTPNFWNLKTEPTFKIDESVLNNYLNVFSEKYSQLSNAVKISVPNYLTPRKLDDKDIKLATYKTIKNLYDKWIGGSKDGEQPYNVGTNNDKTGNKPSLYSSFKFIDQDYNDISSTLKINLTGMLSILDNPNINFLTLISKMLSDNNFVLHKLPVYVDYSNIESVKDMFRVFTNITDINSGVAYIAMYGTGNSKLLDIQTGFEYKGDGYDFINSNTDSSALPGNVNKPAEAGKSKNLVAFRVGFGDENQSIFKNIRISQEEMSDTAEYFKALNDLITNKGGTDRALKGVDIYHLNSVRSYNVNMDMMGNAMIQPLMYLQLDNIPMFHGAYSVININHEITPNKMNTTIRAVKQSKYRTPIVTESTTFVPLDLTKGLALNGGFKIATVTNVESDVIDTKTNNSFTAPVDGDIKITSKKGPRNGKLHKGVDIGVNVGTPIKASWGGIVSKFLQGPNGTKGYGLYVIIDHSDDTNKPFDDGYYYYTLYAHLSECTLNSNVKVQGNQVIAKSGGKYGENNSGNSGGPHLHYEIRRSSDKLINITSYFNLKGSNILDPEQFFKKVDQKIVSSNPQHGQLGNQDGSVLV